MREETERQHERDEPGPTDRESSAVGVDAEDVGDPGVAAELDELRGELDQLSERHLRLAAEFDNYRKRTERDRQALAARLQVDLVSALLDVVDDLERVAESGGATTLDAMVDGIRLVERKFLSILSAAGVDRIAAEGEPFDPRFMEAMATLPTDDPALDDHVADVFQRGYRLGDILVRPARVRVLKYEGPPAGSD